MRECVSKHENSNRFENAVMWSMTLNLAEIILAGGGELSSNISGPDLWMGQWVYFLDGGGRKEGWTN